MMAPPSGVAPGAPLVHEEAPGNVAFLGPDTPDAMAAHIARSHGPSGSNRDYVLTLAEALRKLDIHDEHVFELEALLAESSLPG